MNKAFCFAASVTSPNLARELAWNYQVAGHLHALWNPAVHTQLLVASDELIVVGAGGMYEARCRRCFEPFFAQQKIEEHKQHAANAAGSTLP